MSNREEFESLLSKISISYSGAIPLTLSKAAVLTGLSEEYLRRMVRSGKLYARRPTGKVLLTDTLSLTKFYLAGATEDEAAALLPRVRTNIKRKIRKL